MVSVDMARLLLLLTVIAGAVILLAPQTLNYVVAAYLILTAMVGFGFRRRDRQDHVVAGSEPNSPAQWGTGGACQLPLRGRRREPRTGEDRPHLLIIGLCPARARARHRPSISGGLPGRPTQSPRRDLLGCPCRAAPAFNEHLRRFPYMYATFARQFAMP